MALSQKLSAFVVILSIFLLLHLPEAFAQNIQVTGFVDFSLGTWSGSGDISLEDGLCVYSEASKNIYYVTASGDGTGGDFTISKGADTVAYAVYWKQSGGSYKTMTKNKSTRFTGADLSSSNCGGSSNAFLKVTVAEADMSSAAAGSYSGTLTVMVEP